MLRIRRIKEVIGARVFTDAGDYFGEIEEVNLLGNKVEGWRVKISKESSLVPYLGGAKGVIIPHQFVKAMGDVVIVSKSAVPTHEEKEEAEAE
jgi:sporulation protein YlmC with PRC-barrel domain